MKSPKTKKRILRCGKSNAIIIHHIKDYRSDVLLYNSDTRYNRLNNYYIKEIATIYV